MLKALPDVAPMDPKRIAEVVSAAVDKVPNPESFIAAVDKTQPVYNDKGTANTVTETVKPNKGFLVADETAGEETEE